MLDLAVQISIVQNHIQQAEGEKRSAEVRIIALEAALGDEADEGIASEIDYCRRMVAQRQRSIAALGDELERLRQEQLGPVSATANRAARRKAAKKPAPAGTIRPKIPTPPGLTTRQRGEK